jgi:hypothetical protein
MQEEAVIPSNSNMNKSLTNGERTELCKLCYEGECDAAFIPCGHVTACVKCAEKCEQCPVCRQPYLDIMKLYKQ